MQGVEQPTVIAEAFAEKLTDALDGVLAHDQAQRLTSSPNKMLDCENRQKLANAHGETLLETRMGKIAAHSPSPWQLVSRECFWRDRCSQRSWSSRNQRCS